MTKLTKQQDEFWERFVKQFVVLKEAAEDLDALLELEERIRNGKNDKERKYIFFRALTKSQIVILAALYEEDKYSVPLLLDGIAKGTIVYKDEKIEEVGNVLIREYKKLKGDLDFLRDKASAHLDISIHGPIHGPKMDEILSKNGFLSDLKFFAIKSSLAIKMLQSHIEKSKTDRTK